MFLTTLSSFHIARNLALEKKKLNNFELLNSSVSVSLHSSLPFSSPFPPPRTPNTLPPFTKSRFSSHIICPDYSFHASTPTSSPSLFSFVRNFSLSPLLGKFCFISNAFTIPRPLSLKSLCISRIATLPLPMPGCLFVEDISQSQPLVE